MNYEFENVHRNTTANIAVGAGPRCLPRSCTTQLQETPPYSTVGALLAAPRSCTSSAGLGQEGRQRGPAPTMASLSARNKKRATPERAALRVVGGRQLSILRRRSRVSGATCRLPRSW